MVCDALADFPLDGTFEEAIEAATRRVQEVNDHLLRTAMTSDPADHSGSTVVVLLLRGLLRRRRGRVTVASTAGALAGSKNLPGPQPRGAGGDRCRGIEVHDQRRRGPTESDAVLLDCYGISRGRIGLLSARMG